jgi:hypothetical protein
MKTRQGYPAVAVLKVLHKATLKVAEYDYPTYAEAVTAFKAMKASHPEEIYFLHINIVEVQS